MLIKKDPSKFSYNPDYYKIKHKSRVVLEQEEAEFHLWDVMNEEDADKYCEKGESFALKSNKLDKLLDHIVNEDYETEADINKINSMNTFINSVYSQYTKYKRITRKQLIGLLKIINNSNNVYIRK